MKTLGVIGGLGPMATAYFMQLIVEMTDAKTDQEHIEVLVHSKPTVPDRTRYIIKQSDENPLPQLLAMGEGLIHHGAQVLAIPCITAHYFQHDLDSLSVPVIHVIEETAKTLKLAGVRCAGIMATDGTIQSRLFQTVLAEHGIETVVHTEESQKKVMHIIYEDVKSGRDVEMNLFSDVKEELNAAGAQVVLLGCTELSMVKRDHETGAGVLDVMEVLAREAVKACGKLKPEYEDLITR